jgi:hypothetical protein
MSILTIPPNLQAEQSLPLPLTSTYSRGTTLDLSWTLQLGAIQQFILGVVSLYSLYTIDTW